MPRSPIQSALLERLGPIVNLPDGSYQASITFDREFPGFEGHFPDNPIVPGVCEISLVELLAQLATGKDALRTSRIVKVKFRMPLLPGDCAICTFSLKNEQPVVISATISTPATPRMAVIQLELS